MRYGVCESIPVCKEVRPYTIDISFVLGADNTAIHKDEYYTMPLESDCFLTKAPAVMWAGAINSYEEKRK